jgi:cytochrome c5
VQPLFLNASSEAMSKHVGFVEARRKERDAGLADVAEHAAGRDLPVTTGDACHDDGANGIGAAAVRSVLPTS